MGSQALPGGRESLASCTVPVSSDVSDTQTPARESSLHNPKLAAQQLSARLGSTAAGICFQPWGGHAAHEQLTELAFHLTLRNSGRNTDLEAELQSCVCSVSEEQTQMENGCTHSVEPQAFVLFTLPF